MKLVLLAAITFSLYTVAMEMETSGSWSIFQTDLVELKKEIISHLPYFQLLAIRQVCKEFQAICDEIVLSKYHLRGNGNLDYRGIGEEFFGSDALDNDKRLVRKLFEKSRFRFIDRIFTDQADIALDQVSAVPLLMNRILCPLTLKHRKVQGTINVSPMMLELGLDELVRGSFRISIPEFSVKSYLMNVDSIDMSSLKEVIYLDESAKDKFNPVFLRMLSDENVSEACLKLGQPDSCALVLALRIGNMFSIQHVKKLFEHIDSTMLSGDISVVLKNQDESFIGEIFLMASKSLSPYDLAYLNLRFVGLGVSSKLLRNLNNEHKNSSDQQLKLFLSIAQEEPQETLLEQVDRLTDFDPWFYLPICLARKSYDIIPALFSKPTTKLPNATELFYSSCYPKTQALQADEVATVIQTWFIASKCKDFFTFIKNWSSLLIALQGEVMFLTSLFQKIHAEGHNEAWMIDAAVEQAYSSKYYYDILPMDLEIKLYATFALTGIISLKYPYDGKPESYVELLSENCLPLGTEYCQELSGYLDAVQEECTGRLIALKLMENHTKSDKVQCST